MAAAVVVAMTTAAFATAAGDPALHTATATTATSTTAGRSTSTINEDTPATTASTTARRARPANTASTSSTELAPATTLPPPTTAPTTTTPTPSPTTPSTTTPPTTTPAVGPTRGVPVFEDDFDGATLDGDKWMTCYPWWGVAPSGCTNHGNPEQQWYLPEQVTTGNGALRLTAERTPTQGVDRNGNPVTFPYRSGIVTSARRFSFTYGYVEFRARIPKGQAMWPALWLLPTDYSWPPEIDAMEAAGGDTTRVSVTFHGSDGRAPQKVVAPNGVDFAVGWHTFAVNWSPTAITWYVDGTAVLTVTEAVPTKPMYLLANLAVGGPAGAVTDASPQEATFEVDYVKVWLPA